MTKTCVSGGVLGVIAAGLLSLLASPCARADSVEYRFILKSPGGDLPFVVTVPREPGEGVAHIHNGEEDIAVNVRREGGKLTFDLSKYDATLDAVEQEDGSLKGRWEKTSRDGATVGLDLVGDQMNGDPCNPGFAMFNTPFNDPNSSFEFRPPADVGGVWRIKFAESGAAKGVLRMAGCRDGMMKLDVRGTVLTPTGDYRYLAGTSVNEFRMSAFDGAHAFLFKATIASDKATMTGDFYSGATFHETFTAERIPEGQDFQLPDPFTDTTLKPGEHKLGLAQLNDPKYAGKAVVVQMFGSWCPNCHDEAPVLADLYKKHHAEGLEVLGLAYEYTGDDERSRRQIARFKERYAIPWDIVIAGTADKDKAAATVPGVSALKGFPTTIFVNRDGTVRAIHTGFCGPATGAEFEKLKAEFEKLIVESLKAK